MAATIRKRTTSKLDKYGNPVASYQVRWREPVRNEFGAPTGQFKQTGLLHDQVTVSVTRPEWPVWS